MPRGKSIATAAVLEIHIERTEQRRRKTKTVLFALFLAHEIFNVNEANVSSRFVISSAFASRKPPRNKKMIGLANGAKASFTGTIPKMTLRHTPRIPGMNRGRSVKSQSEITNEKIARKIF